ncbi:enoyl-CoA hydratase/isomerase family protein [Ottowia sp. VDI28]|uniref:enoyl-CoA hydratase/isomerase family protein n=1 Tax=Ottowia sp. VDI28 TaxID=3133968 RepID=UPI003C2FC71F
MGQNILIEHDAACTVLTLNRPEKLNPLDWSTVRELKEAVNQLGAGPPVLVTGAGRAFCAGGDLTGYIGLYKRPEDFRAFLFDFRDMLVAIERSERIFIAAINGACAAGGLELLLACDIVLAAQDAQIGDAHLNFGQLPGAGGSQRLPRAIGSLRAKHLMLSGRFLSGQEAMDIGLANEVVPGSELMPRARAFARKLVEHSPGGLRGVKHLVNQGMGMPLAEALEFEIDYVHRYATTDTDATEGLRAFAEKRQPAYRSFKG